MEAIPHIEDMSFAFGTVIQIITIVGVSLSGIFYLRRGFETNRIKLEEMEKRHSETNENFADHRQDLKDSLQSMSRKLDNNHAQLHNLGLEIAKIHGRKHAIEARLDAVEHVQKIQAGGAS